MMKPDPECKVPAKTIRRGGESGAFQISARVLSGDPVTVDLDVELTDEPASPGRHLLQSAKKVKGISIKKLAFGTKGSQKEIYSGTPIELRAVVYLLNICNMLSPFQSASDFHRYMYKTTPAGQPGSPDNLQNYYQTCSRNKTFFDPSKVMVVGPINVPCSGALTRGSLSFPWSANGCGAAEQVAWLDIAEAYARQHVAPNDPAVASVLSWTERRRVIVILPAAVKCPWAGLGVVGCVGPLCTAYIKGTYATQMAVIYHELQHNFGLGHAMRGGNEYGDSTDSMGDAASVSSSPLCHNAPYLYRIGWATTISAPGAAATGDGAYGNLTASNFTASNTMKDVQLPAAGTSDNSMIRVALGAVDTGPTGFRSAYPTLFISYRSKRPGPSGYDAGLPSGMNQRVFIHAFNGTIWERDYNRSDLLAIGTERAAFTAQTGTSAGSSWSSNFVPVDPILNTGGALKVTVKLTTPDYAVVDLCHVRSLKEGSGPDDEACSDGLDNDCDGLADDSDPDCNPAAAVRPPPAGSPPPALPPPAAKSPKQPSPPPPSFRPPPPHPPSATRPSPPPKAGKRSKPTPA